MQLSRHADGFNKLVLLDLLNIYKHDLRLCNHKLPQISDIYLVDVGHARQPMLLKVAGVVGVGQATDCREEVAGPVEFAVSNILDPNLGHPDFLINIWVDALAINHLEQTPN